MANLMEVYKCELCGNVVEVVFAGGGELVCCGKPMKHLAANTVDAAKEKHVPVATVTPEGIKVVVGSVAHPMEEKHYIVFIELIADGQVHRVDLKPGAKPEAFFPVKPAHFTVREWCNLHGVWQAKVG